MSDGVRLDMALVARGLARSRGQAADIIAAGSVRVNGRPARRAAERIGPDDLVEADADPWVSRAAHKLLGAVEGSGVRLRGRALDAGASTGGFTQVLLDAGCAPVYAVDVGHGQLVAALRADRRVVVREGLNLRDLTLADVGGVRVDTLVADVSFISLRLLLAPLLAVLADGGAALLLVKPQFEVGRGGLDSRGVVADPARALAAVDAVVADAAGLGWPCVWRSESPLPGAAGNREWFVALSRGGSRQRTLG